MEKKKLKIVLIAFILTTGIILSENTAKADWSKMEIGEVNVNQLVGLWGSSATDTGTTYELTTDDVIYLEDYDDKIIKVPTGGDYVSIQVSGAIVASGNDPYPGVLILAPISGEQDGTARVGRVFIW